MTSRELWVWFHKKYPEGDYFSIDGHPGSFYHFLQVLTRFPLEKEALYHPDCFDIFKTYLYSGKSITHRTAYEHGQTDIEFSPIPLLRRWTGR